VTLPFSAGDVCLLVDGRGRHYTTRLESGKRFEFHRGFLAHDEIIGSADGTLFRSSGAARLVALRPRLTDYILGMKRGAQVVYPKDIAPMLLWGDVAPGMTVLEAGTGSGALTMATLRAVGPGGTVVSVERRDDHARHARKMIAAFFGDEPPNLDLRIGDVEDHIADVAPDRLLLDIPEPWSAVPPAARALPTGAVFVCYLPTVPQVQQVREAIRREQAFIDVVTFEVLMRDWAFEGRSVRPAHQMIGHTGFITVARRVQPLAEEAATGPDGPETTIAPE
jgi:tRNA (adenine57-N1/adenine58-N1)-methyltransferase